MSKKINVKNPSHLATTSYKNLKDLQGNLKTISNENLEKLKQSIIKYGIFVPKFVWIENNKNYWIEDGHQTIKALAALEKENYIIPDIRYVKVECNNKKDAAEKLLQINSRYGIINPETTFFEDFDIDLDFINDIEIPELDIKLDELESEIVEDEVPEPPIEPLSKTGDLWICGKHRILCGDATKEADILKLMDGKKADCILTDPPYGINFDYDSYEDTEENWFTLFDGIIPMMKRISTMVILPCCKIARLPYIYKKYPPDWLICWYKGSPGHRSFVGFNDWEPLLVYGKNKNVQMHDYFFCNAVTPKLKHPCPKPVKWAEWLITRTTEKNDIIADFFLGSGTTLIAAKQLNRICYGCEISEAYCDVILERWAKLTEQDPIRESDGVKWSELKSSSEKRTD